MTVRGLAAAAVLAISGTAVAGCAMNPGPVSTAGRTDITAAPPTVAPSPSETSTPTAKPTHAPRPTKTPTQTPTPTDTATPTQTPTTDTTTADAAWVTMRDAKSGVRFAFPQQVAPQSNASSDGKSDTRTYTAQVGSIGSTVAITDMTRAATAKDLQAYSKVLLDTETGFTGVKPVLTHVATTNAGGRPTLDEVATYTTKKVTLVWHIHLAGGATSVVNASTAAFGDSPDITAAGDASQQKLIAGIVLAH